MVIDLIIFGEEWEDCLHFMPVGFTASIENIFHSPEFSFHDDLFKITGFYVAFQLEHKSRRPNLY